MTARYYNKPEDVKLISPLPRFLAKVFGAKHFVSTCSVCGKIPTEVYVEGSKNFCGEHAVS